MAKQHFINYLLIDTQGTKKVKESDILKFKSLLNSDDPEREILFDVRNFIKVVDINKDQ